MSISAHTDESRDSIGTNNGSVDGVAEPPRFPFASNTRFETPIGQPGGRARYEWSTGLFCLLFDIVSWLVIYKVTAYIRQEAFSATPFQSLMIDLIQLGAIVSAISVVGGYDRDTETRSLAYTTEHILAVIGAGALSAMLIYAAAAYDSTMKPSRGVLLFSFVAFLPVSLAYRRAIRRLISKSTAERAFLVIGSGELATHFYGAYRQSPTRQRLEFVDIAGERVGQHIAGPGTPVIEGDLLTKLERLDSSYSGVIIAERVDRLQPELLDRLVRTQFLRARVYTLEGFYEAHWRRVPVRSIDPFWPLQMGFQLARVSPYHYLKRIVDTIGSALLLLVTAPLYLIIFPMIWLQDGRPAIFRQTRVGRDNHNFTAFKFRTMIHSTEETAMYTRRSDPRITPLGKWLRKLRIDELPQLWNVFRGEMSLIGPRAEWIRCAERYEKIIPFYHFRHLVKPGITGWAQVNYPYGESEEDAIQKLKYDLYYIRHYSLKLDAMIVLKTIYTVVFGKGQ
jgi:exopolysaccharide biosynthesis polyprenyl glycosylphosphotransferase